MQLKSNRNSTSSMSSFIFDSHKRMKSTIQVINDPSSVSGFTICICSFSLRTDWVGGEGRGAAGNALTGSVLRTDSLTHSPLLGNMEARASQPANTVSPANIAGWFYSGGLGSCTCAHGCPAPHPGRHFGSLNPAVVGVFPPRKLTTTTDQHLSSLPTPFTLRPLVLWRFGSTGERWNIWAFFLFLKINQRNIHPNG